VLRKKALLLIYGKWAFIEFPYPMQTITVCIFFKSHVFYFIIYFLCYYFCYLFNVYGIVFLCRALLMVFVWHVLCQCDIIGYVGCRGRFWWTLRHLSWV